MFVYAAEITLDYCVFKLGTFEKPMVRSLLNAKSCGNCFSTYSPAKTQSQDKKVLFQQKLK